MDLYKINYSTALKGWVLVASKDGKDKVVFHGSDPAECLKCLGHFRGYNQEAKFTVLVEKVKNGDMRVIPDLGPFENNVHGRASRAAIAAYASTLREHGQSNFADQLKEVVEDAETRIQDEIKEGGG